MTRKDEDRWIIVDYILDAAGNKGTGNGRANQLLILISTSITSLFCNVIFLLIKEERVQASKSSSKPTAIKFDGDKAELVKKNSPSSMKIMSYAQGFPQCVLHLRAGLDAIW